MAADHAQYGPGLDVLPANVADGILKRNAANTAWEFKTETQLCGLIQTVFSEVTVDTSRTNTGYATLLTANITTGANSLLIQFSASFLGGSNGADCRFRITLDGAVQRGAYYENASGNAAGSVSVVLKRSVTAAAHIVLVEWSSSAGSIDIRPVTVPNTEHASLLVQEVRV